MRIIRKTDPCVCDSGKTWGKCCGELISEDCMIVPLTEMRSSTAHYFVVGRIPDLTTFRADVFKDEEGRVPVFATRAQANALAAQLSRKVVESSESPPHTAELYTAVGIKRDSFHLFLAEHPDSYIVPASTISA